MTLNEYEERLLTMNYEEYILRDDKPARLIPPKTADKLISLHKLKKQLLIECKDAYSFTLQPTTPEHILQTYDIYTTNRKALEKSFNYYDTRNKELTLVPRGLYTKPPLRYYTIITDGEHHTKELKLKQLPKELQTFQGQHLSVRGYEIPTKVIARIFKRETNLVYEIREAEEAKLQKIEAQRVARHKPKYTY